MSSNPIPSVLINAKIYSKGSELMGAGTAEFPDFEYMTESVSGLGLAGEIDLPVLGHFKNLGMSIKWNSVCENSVKLLAPTAHDLTIYGSVQNWRSSDGTFAPTGVKVTVRATPKKSGVGKFEPGKKMEPSSEFTLTYVKMSIGGKEILEIDPINFLCRINGTDYLSEVRSQLGM